MSATYPAPGARFVRLAEKDRASLALSIDGQQVSVLQGDTLLVALLNHRRSLRASEFGDGERAGFCLMGACQDCWIWTESGQRLRACSTTAEEGMALRSRPPAQYWPLTPDLKILQGRSR